MNEELNIRAAKALGWRPSSNMTMAVLNGIAHGHICGYVDPKTDTNYLFSELLFDTSYDWAMLLVKECEKLMAMDEFSSALVRIIKSLNDNMSIGQLGDVLLATPEQITQAAVEVLEKQCVIRSRS